MPIAPALLELLVCPVTKQPLNLLPGARLESLNRLIKQGEVTNIGGTTLKTPLDEALITRNGATIYPVARGIPLMLEGEGIAVTHLSGF